MPRSKAQTNALIICAALCFTACSVGSGEGEITGVLEDPICGLSGEYSLDPDFFASNAFEGALEIRVQTGGDFELFEDGIAIVITDVAEVHAQRGEPIELDGERDSLVTMTFFANDSCPVNEDDIPVHYIAVEGRIEFSSVYAPDISSDQLLTDALLTNVRFVDPNEPETRFALLSGWFTFLHNRGRPAQPFP